MTKIKTERLVLRKLSMTDAPRMAELGNNKKIWLNLTDSFPHPYTLKNAEDWIEKNLKQKQQTDLAITINKELIGMIGYKDNKTYLEIGYWLGEPYWGNGYATEALNAFIKYLEKNKKEIRAKVFTYNPASGKVLEKCGFKKQDKTITTIKAGKPQQEQVYVKRKTV